MRKNDLKRKIRHYDTLYEVSMNDINLSSFEVKDELNPKLWVNDKINSRVRVRLLDIADDFIDSLSTNWVKPKDIVITGSLANYNWSKYSDIDLHVIVDYKEVYKKSEFVEDYFKSKKDAWNKSHENLKIYGFPVELYVEDLNNPTHSSGVFSLLKNKWVKEPKNMDDALMNQDYIKDVSAKYMTQIDKMEEKLEKDLNTKEIRKINAEAKRLLNKLKDKRKKGLDTKAQEMSSGNIIWKVLRREKYVKKLTKIIDDTYNEMKSYGDD